MKKITLLSALSFFLILLISDGYTQQNPRLSDIFTPGETAFLKKGEILTYARIDGKGEVYSGSLHVSFPAGAGLFYDNPSGYSVAAVEKCFFSGELSERNRIFEALKEGSSFKGMKYFSITGGRVQPLVLESYTYGNRDDSVKGDGASSLFNFTIRDNRLGVIPFRSEVSMSGGSIRVVNISSGRVSRFGMKVFEPGDYRVYRFVMYDRGAGGWFYCSVQLMRVRSDIMKSLDLLKPENICNRLRGETVHLLSLFGHDRSARIAAFR